MDFIPRPQFDEWFHIASALNIGPFAAAIQTLMSSTSQNKLPNSKVTFQLQHLLEFWSTLTKLQGNHNFKSLRWGKNFPKPLQKYAKASELWGPIINLFYKDLGYLCKWWFMMAELMRPKNQKKSNPEGILEVMSSKRKKKKFKKSSSQNLPLLITELVSKSNQRQRNLPKIPAEASNKWRYLHETFKISTA